MARYLLAATATGVPSEGDLVPSLTDVLARIRSGRRFVEAHAVVHRMGNSAVHVTAVRIDDRHAGIQVCALAQRPDQVFRLLVDRLGFSATDARLALRVQMGSSTAEIAAAFGTSVGAIKTRLSRLYRRLGLRDRASLAKLVEAARERCERHEARIPALAPLKPRHSGMVALVEGLSSALAVADSEQRWRWCNAAARGYLRSAAAVPLSKLLAEEWARLALRRDDRAPARVVKIDIGGVVLRSQIQSWRIGPSLFGLKLDPTCDGADRDQCVLMARLGLSRQQAQVATLLYEGSPTMAIAARLGICRTSVRVVSSAIYERVGVRDRASLIALLSHVL